MKNFFIPLGPAAEAAYAEVFDQAKIRSANRSVVDLTGTFAKKTVSGHEYWYFQYRDVDQKLKQVYLGARNARLDRLIELKGVARSGQMAITKQARAAIALGNTPTPKSHIKIIRRAEEYGYFKAGGILLGSNAFLSYGNMLGVDWYDDGHREDMNFALTRQHVPIALPINVHLNEHDAITSLEMGFFPASKLEGLVDECRINPKESNFCLDVITIERGNKSELIKSPILHDAMAPLKFMEYLLKDLRQATIVADDGAVLVTVPNPARYAFHTLIVAGLGKSSTQSTASKSLRQAASLISYLSKHLPGDLVEAWEDLYSRGPSWREKFAKDVALMLSAEPDIENALSWELPK